MFHFWLAKDISVYDKLLINKDTASYKLDLHEDMFKHFDINNFN